MKYVILVAVLVLFVVAVVMLLRSVVAFVKKRKSLKQDNKENLQEVDNVEDNTKNI